MTNQEMLDVVQKADWVSSQNVKDPLIYERLTAISDLIKSRKSDDKHQLNSANVTGVWYLTNFNSDDTANPQVLIRTRLAVGTYERLLLSSEICKVINNDDEYDFDTEYAVDNSVFKGIQRDIYDAFINGEALAVYDSERGDNK